jgi:hypothetical protein
MAGRQAKRARSAASGPPRTSRLTVADRHVSGAGDRGPIGRVASVAARQRCPGGVSQALCACISRLADAVGVLPNALLEMGAGGVLSALAQSEGVCTKRQLEPWVRRGVTYARSLPPKG